MATIDSGDVIRIAIEYNLADNTQGYGVHHYQATAGTGGSPATILNDIATYIEAVYELNDHVFVTETSSEEAQLFKYDFTNHRWDGLVNQALSAFIGDDALAHNPNGLAGLGKLFTDVARRQGRKYFFGMSEAQVTDGNLVAGAITAYGDILDDLGDIIVSSGITLKPGVFNTDAASVLYETFELFNDTYAVETIVSYQRRRKPGVGI